MARAPKVTIKLEGEKEIRAALQQKGRDAKNVIERAALAGAEVVREDASRRAQRRSGFLAEHIVAATEKKTGSQVVVTVGPDREAFYGLFIEFGADAHHIGPQTKKALEIAEGTIRAGAEHGGIQASPFMRPAYDEKKEEVQTAVNREFKKALDL